MFVQQSDQNWVYFTLKGFKFNTATSWQRYTARTSSIALTGSREMSPGVEEKQLEKKFFPSLSKFFFIPESFIKCLSGAFFLEGDMRKQCSIRGHWRSMLFPCHFQRHYSWIPRNKKFYNLPFTRVWVPIKLYQRLPVFHCPHNWFQKLANAALQVWPDAISSPD